MTDKRNQPCPCGSGKRYKKCCGFSGGTAAVAETWAAHEKADGTLAAEKLFQMGLAAAGQKRFKEAEASFRRALAIKPDLTEAHYNLGVILETLGSADRAKACYQQALEHDPAYINALINLGCILMEQGKMEEAFSTFLRALNVQPDNAVVHYNLGGILKEQGRMDEAIPWFKKALTLKPDYGAAYKSLALIVKFTEADDLIHAMEDLYNKKGDLSDTDLIHLVFALGKAFEDLRDYSRSFDFILEANRLKRRMYKYSLNGTRRNCI